MSQTTLMFDDEVGRRSTREVKKEKKHNHTSQLLPLHILACPVIFYHIIPPLQLVLTLSVRFNSLGPVLRCATKFV